MMKIDVVTPSIASSSGGVGAAVLDIYSNLQHRNKKLIVDILSLKSSALHDSENILLNSKTFKRFPPNSLGLSIPLLKNAVKSDADIVHLHGVWMATSIYPIVSKLTNKTPYVISPHGMLDPWILNRGKAKKKIAKLLYEKYSWSKCSVFHALNTAEADAILKIIPNAKIKIIPNGIHVNKDNKPIIPNPDKVVQILFLGRFHEKKNIHSLIKGVNLIPSKIYESYPFVLNIAGWGDEGYTKTIKNLINESDTKRFNFIGPVFGLEKDRLLNQSDLFILPSFSEGLPVAILEAWANGLPVIMSDFCNLPDAFVNGCALSVGTEPTSISNIIQEFLFLNMNQRHDLASAGFDYVEENYNWDVVCKSFEDLYTELTSSI